MNPQPHIFLLLVLPILGFCQTKNNQTLQKPMLTFVIENDLLLPSHTDRYYTNGFEIGYSASKPLFKFQDLLINNENQGYNVYGLSINSQMFAPSSIRQANNIILNNRNMIAQGLEPIKTLDRPYAGTLMAHLRTEFNNPSVSTRLTTLYSLGVMGPAAQQDAVQVFFHRLMKRPIPNWENQLPNDLAVNVNIKMDKKILTLYPYTDMIGSVSANVGTLTNALKLGGLVRFGKLSEYFKGTLNSENEIALFFGHNVCFYYDQAVLEGGVFSRLTSKTQYAIPRESLNHMYYEMNCGLNLNLKKVRLTYSQNLRSPEFKTAQKMFWGNITVSTRI